jgi:hypothetical protein
METIGAGPMKFHQLMGNMNWIYMQLLANAI